MLIYGFNEARNNIASSSLKVGYESMSAILFWTTTKGNLPHLSYIFREPEQLGTEFRTVDFSVTGTFLLIEVNRRKEWMKHRKYQRDIVANAACTKSITEATEGIGQ